MFNITNHYGNTNQNHDETGYLLEWLASKRQEITSVREDVEIRKTSCTVGGDVNWCSYMEWKQCGGSSKRKKKKNYHMIQ